MRGGFCGSTISTIISLILSLKRFLIDPGRDWSRESIPVADALSSGSPNNVVASNAYGTAGALDVGATSFATFDEGRFEVDDHEDDDDDDEATTPPQRFAVVSSWTVTVEVSKASPLSMEEGA